MSIFAYVVNAVCLGFLFTFVLGVIRAVRRKPTVITKEVIQDADAVLLRIDKVESNTVPVFLVYEVNQNKFLFQGITADEIAVKIVEKFADKRVFVQTDDEKEPYASII